MNGMTIGMNGHDHGAETGLETGLDDTAMTRQRLEHELDAARAAVDEAQLLLAEREAGLKTALRDELMASRARLAELDRQHDLRMTAIRAETEAAIALIMHDVELPSEEHE